MLLFYIGTGFVLKEVYHQKINFNSHWLKPSMLVMRTNIIVIIYWPSTVCQCSSSPIPITTLAQSIHINQVTISSQPPFNEKTEAQKALGNLFKTTHHYGSETTIQTQGRFHIWVSYPAVLPGIMLHFIEHMVIWLHYTNSFFSRFCS